MLAIPLDQLAAKRGLLYLSRRFLKDNEGIFRIVCLWEAEKPVPALLVVPTELWSNFSKPDRSKVTLVAKDKATVE